MVIRMASASESQIKRQLISVVSEGCYLCPASRPPFQDAAHAGFICQGLPTTEPSFSGVMNRTSHPFMPSSHNRSALWVVKITCRRSLYRSPLCRLLIGLAHRLLKIKPTQDYIPGLTKSRIARTSIDARSPKESMSQSNVNVPFENRSSRCETPWARQSWKRAFNLSDLSSLQHHVQRLIPSFEACTWDSEQQFWSTSLLRLNDLLVSAMRSKTPLPERDYAIFEPLPRISAPWRTSLFVRVQANGAKIFARRRGKSGRNTALCSTASHPR